MDAADCPNVTMEGCGALRDCRYLLHDRDTTVHPVLPSDHRVRSDRAARATRAQSEPECLCGALGQVGVKEECLSKVLLFGERSLRRAFARICRTTSMPSGITKGKAMSYGSLEIRTSAAMGPVQCRERLGGLLRYYHQEAA